MKWKWLFWYVRCRVYHRLQLRLYSKLWSRYNRSLHHLNDWNYHIKKLFLETEGLQKKCEMKRLFLISNGNNTPRERNITLENTIILYNRPYVLSPMIYAQTNTLIKGFETVISVENKFFNDQKGGSTWIFT